MIGTEEKKGTQKEVTIDRKANLKSHRLYWIGRRAQDIFFSALALIALSPVMLVTALAVVVDDPGGSPIFAQERVGRNGKLVKFYKFRSMCVDAEAKLERYWYRIRWMVRSLRLRKIRESQELVSSSERQVSMSCTALEHSQGRYEYCWPKTCVAERG
ncbi:sugar transferase [Enterococcus faecium]